MPERLQTLQLVVLWALAATFALGQDELPITELRIDVLGGMADPSAGLGEAVDWIVEAPSDIGCVPIEATVVLVSRLEPCFSQPELCEGA